MQHANNGVRLLVPLLSLILLTFILLAQRRTLSIRRIYGLTAIEEAVGRATEMGRPMVGVPGLGGIDIVTLQAVAILAYVARLGCRYSIPILIPVADTTLLPLVQETLQDMYLAEGRPDLYNPDNVRFLSNRQFSFAASVAGTILRERAAACFYFGSYYAEALIFSEVGQQIGAIQIAGTPSTLQIPFFIATCDYVIIGDEFYAASAYLTREPILLGSIIGQDICKLLLILLVVMGTVSATFFPSFLQLLTQFLLRGG